MIGVLVTNLGTPAAPTAPALRKYLAQFLGDRRVVQLPRLLWLPILYGPILTFRPKKSAEKYAKIWTSEGSPLKVHTERQGKLLKGLLGQRHGTSVTATWAMRYGDPDIAHGLEVLVAKGAQRIVVLPLYPQFSGSTTLSTQDAVGAWRKNHATVPISEVQEYHEHPSYITALANSVKEHWMTNGKAEHLVMSFHGIPVQAVERGDPYAAQCRRSAQLLAAALDLEPDKWTLCFQSRFGPAKWLQPYTQATIETLAKNGTRSVDVICPGFSSDCLETLEEISMEVKAAFLENGGQEFRYIPCLNERPDHIAALADIVTSHLGLV